MKTWIISILALAAFILAVEGVTTIAMKNVNRAHCTTCPSYKCFGKNSCGYSCQCVIIGSGPGVCATVQ